MLGLRLEKAGEKEHVQRCATNPHPEPPLVCHSGRGSAAYCLRSMCLRLEQTSREDRP